MRNLLSALVAFLVVQLPANAYALLQKGADAPAITLDAAHAGKVEQFSLGDALSKGPVVVYFYPKSFTSVCTLEANLFAEAMPQFEKLGASVIGISTDDIETQKEFSTKECRDKFPVAADADGAVAKAYDSARARGGDSVMAARTSYVITPDGKIASAHAAGDAESHIATALKFLKAHPKNTGTPKAK